jgi:ubiquitin-like 1-activating enzyme E1 B
VFSEDIRRLLSMEDMWKVPGRVKPVPLDYEAISQGTFAMPHAEAKTQPPATQGQTSGSEQAAGPSTKTLKDQRELSLKDNLDLFIDRWVV